MSKALIWEDQGFHSTTFPGTREKVPMKITCIHSKYMDLTKGIIDILKDLATHPYTDKKKGLN